MYRFKMVLPMTLWLVFSTVLAAPYQPNSDDAVLLQLDSIQTPLLKPSTQANTLQKTLPVAKSLLQTAMQPGHSDQYQRAEAILAPYVSQSDNPELLYLWAQIKQHQHQFTVANEQLTRIFQQQPKHVPARLMAARLALIHRDLVAAKQHCQALLGHVDVVTTQICLLEVDSYQGALDSSYAQLKQIMDRWTVPTSHQTWLTLMRVDMAMRMDDFKAATNDLELFPAFNDRSYLTTWADVKLHSGQAQEVVDQMQQLNQSDATLEDGLLLRLAIAEQQLNRKNKSANDAWGKLLEQRLALRAERDETMHANEMARYFMYLQPAPAKALYWAELNWQESKEHQDEMLLQAARQGVAQ